MNIQTEKNIKPDKEKRIKNSGTTAGYGDNGGATVTNDNFRNNFGNIDWSKK